MPSNYDKYIWQIQFKPYRIQDYLASVEYCTKIDYINRKITFFKTDIRRNCTSQKVYEIDDKDFRLLLSYSKIRKIKSFENKTEEQLKKYWRGYRDGWFLQYSYFTKEETVRVDGKMRWIYMNNPMEKIVRWVHKIYPEMSEYI